MAITACLVTGKERAAIATIELRGPGSGEVIHQNVKLAVQREVAANEIRYGTWQASNAGPSALAGESVVVVSVGPGPDTGIHRDPIPQTPRQPQEAWEIHCHGGEVAAKRILDDLAQCGVAICDQDAWPSICGHGRLYQESMHALSRTSTARTAGYVLDQVRGAMQNFAEQSLAAIREEGRGGLERVQAEAARILSFADFGLHLSSPWSVVLAGCPNVGKSSLINALVGYERSITLDQPGTTRDVLHADAVLDGWPMVLTDTAGIRGDTRDEIERQGITRARNRISDADLVIWVSDATLRTDADQTPPASRPRRMIRVLNKIDLSDHPSETLVAGQIATAATSGQGIESLRMAIVQALVPEQPMPGSPLPINERQVVALRRILAAPDGGSLRQAFAGLMGG
ncbi:MAG: GTPase [Planctomycetaceae bacterium]